MEAASAPSPAASYATAGGGNVLEHGYGAVLLACLWTGNPVSELGDDVTPTEVKFQAGAISAVDDLLIRGETPNGGSRRLSVGVRRAPQLTRSDKKSLPLIASYLRVVTGSWEEVHAGRWRLALAAASPNSAVTQAGELGEFARDTGSPAAFWTEMEDGVHRRDLRKRLDHLRDLIVAACDQVASARDIDADEVTWRFLVSLWPRLLRLEGADTSDRTVAVMMLRPFTEEGTAAAAAAFFDRLERLARRYALTGAIVDKATLRRDLSGMRISSASRSLWTSVAVEAAEMLPELPRHGTDASVPNSARVWRHWLGGKEGLEADRRAGDQYHQTYPEIESIVRESRAFLARTVRFLVDEAQIRQILDIGAGFPATENTHQIAQEIAPETRVVYADNDAVVMAYAHALLRGASADSVGYVLEDLREPEKVILGAAATLDFTQPVAILLLRVLGHVTDDGQALSIVGQLLKFASPGSYLVICDGTSVINKEASEAAQRNYNHSGAIPYKLRSPDELARFFEGLDLVSPGLVSCPLWRPDSTASDISTQLDAFGAVGRKMTRVH